MRTKVDTVLRKLQGEARVIDREPRLVVFEGRIDSATDVLRLLQLNGVPAELEMMQVMGMPPLVPFVDFSIAPFAHIWIDARMESRAKRLLARWPQLEP